MHTSLDVVEEKGKIAAPPPPPGPVNINSSYVCLIADRYRGPGERVLVRSEKIQQGCVPYLHHISEIMTLLGT